MRSVLYIVSGVLVFLLAVAAIYIVTFDPAQRPPLAIRVPETREVLQRGEYLVEHVAVCGGCHTPRDWTRLAGPETGEPMQGAECYTEAYDFPGTVCAGNLTPDEETGLGRWTDGEILRAIREGVNHEGKALVAIMPYRSMRLLSEPDAGAIVAYLRQLRPVSNRLLPKELAFPISFFMDLQPQPLSGPVEAPPESETIRYGAYLAWIAGCHRCHTPVDATHKPLAGKDFSGGQVFVGEWGKVVSANITPHETGIGLLDRDAFIARFVAFRDAAAMDLKAGKNENTLMPWRSFAGMTEEDLGAIYDYLRTVEPVPNEVVIYPER